MNRRQRIQSFLMGLGMLLCCGILLLNEEIGYVLAAVFIIFSMIAYGIRLLIYYHTMARHMVGGKAMLFLAVLILNFGLFVSTVVDDPMLFLLLYLLLFHGFGGAISVMRAMETRRFSASTWVLSLLEGIVNLGVAIAAVIAALVLHSVEVIDYLYIGCLFCSALVRIGAAFRRTAVVYIQ